MNQDATRATELMPRAGVVVVDVQNDFCAPGGTMDRRGMDMSAIGRAVENAARLIDAARARGIPVVHVRTGHDEQVDSAAWDARYVDPNAKERNCRTGTWGAEPFGVTERSGEPVVVKHRYSAFSVPRFAEFLREQGLDSLFVLGVATEVCVETTLRDAVDADFRVVLVADASATYEPHAHSCAAERVAQHWGDVLTTDTVINQHFSP